MRRLRRAVLRRKHLHGERCDLRQQQHAPLRCAVQDDVAVHRSDLLCALVVDVRDELWALRPVERLHASVSGQGMSLEAATVVHFGARRQRDGSEGELTIPPTPP